MILFCLLGRDNYLTRLAIIAWISSKLIQSVKIAITALASITLTPFPADLLQED